MYLTVQSMYIIHYCYSTGPATGQKIESLKVSKKILFLTYPPIQKGLPNPNNSKFLISFVLKYQFEKHNCKIFAFLSKVIEFYSFKLMQK